MTRRLIIATAASDESIRAAAWLEERRPGYGKFFLLEFDRTVKLIHDYPELYAMFRGPLRRAVIHRFGYSVAYQLVTDAVVIVGVQADTRHPRTWAGRAFPT